LKKERGKEKVKKERERKEGRKEEIAVRKVIKWQTQIKVKELIKI
jgi:hypothetical protein